MKIMITPILLLLCSGCASVTYEKTDPKTGLTTKGSMKTYFSTSAVKGFSIGHVTKTTETGLQIKEGNTSPDADFAKAIMDGLSDVVGKAAEGAAKGAKPIP